MSVGCGCAPTAPCACSTPVDAAHEAALSVGGSIGSLVAMLGARLSVDAGAAHASHGRNQILGRLGFPHVTFDGRLVDPVNDPAGIAVGYGLDLDAGDPDMSRSTSWRHVTFDADPLTA